ncbi:MAG: hypothetical protein ORN23_03205 [Chthoniobacterales bacterium]|nr:hypothetical protein [Chthoniobacterales bacterium]
MPFTNNLASKVSLLTHVSVLLLVTCSSLVAGQAISTSEATNSSSGFQEWIQQTVLHPEHHYETIQGKNPDGWAFILQPYGWLPGVYGQIGAKGLPPVNVNQSPIQVLSKLNWATFLKAEVRHGRWGVIGDGFYAKFSAPGNPSGQLYQSATATLNQSIDSLVAAYRVIDDLKYFADLYAGARYYYMGLQVAATPSQITKFQNPRANAAATALLPTAASTDTSWVDPIVGLRARVNLTRFLYLEALGDVGGFDAGSQIAWNTQATIGARLTRNIDFEAGYRYMYIDYVKGSLDCNLNFAGALAGIVFKF